MVRTGGSEAHIFVGFAVLDELIRTLRDKGVLDDGEIIAALERCKTAIEQIKSLRATESVEIIKEMLREYRKQAR